jgi:hypothetical protein
MHIRTLLIAAATLAALTPAVSNAGPESAALKTCTAAFASSLHTAKGTESPAVKLNYHSGAPSSEIAEYYTRDYTFFLKANDPKTGLPMARAQCSATTAGTLLSLSAIPLDAAGAVLAAKL